MNPIAKALLAKSFANYSHQKLVEEYWPRLRSCVESLTDEQIWWRPNESSNSVGNLILHLSGNVRQWLVSSFNHLEDARDRPAEFSARESIPAAVLLTQMEATLKEASEVLQRLTEADLLTIYDIQGYTVNGLEAVYQVVEHFAMHYGQILYITKLVRSKNLGFYAVLDETGRLPAAATKDA